MPSKATTPIDDDAVRTRAYLMWEADGYPDGRADHYWGLAHAEATSVTRKPKRAAASAKSSVPEKTAKPKAAAKAKKPKAKS